MELRFEILLVILSLLLLQGLVTATANSITLEDNILKSGQSTDVNVTADQTTDDVYVILDNNSNGNYDVSTDLLVSGSISSTGVSQQIGNFSATNTSSIEEGNYTVYGVQQSSEPSDGEDITGEESTSIEFDNTDPNITNYTAGRASFYSANISFVSNETIGGISVEREPALVMTNEDSFSSNSSSGAILYWSVINIEEEGTNTFSLQYAGDLAGNNGASGEEESVEMDPIVRDFSLSSGDQNPEAEIISYDELDSLNVSLGKNASGYLGMADFSETYDSSNDQYTYTADLEGDDGEINATLLEAVNTTGHDGAWGQTDEGNFQIPPTIENFYLTASDQNVTLHVDVNENLSMLNASYDGNVSSGELDYSNFTESTDSGYYNYTTDIPSGEDGTYNTTFNFAEDDSGNRNSTELTDEIVVDSVAPSISEFSVSNDNTPDVDVSFNSSEELSTINATGSGIESFTLTESDFSTDESEAPFEYLATYSVENEGNLTVELNEAADISGNDGASSQNETLNVTYPPTIHVFDLFANDTDVDLEINSSEQLQNITVDLSRDVSGTLSLSNFTESSPDSNYIYIANVSDNQSGEFEAALQLAEDKQSLDGSDGESDLLILDDTPPPDPRNTTLLDDPINADNDDSLSVEINFSSTTETGELEVRFNDSAGNSMTASRTVDSTDKIQTFTGFDVSSLADGDIRAESRMTDDAGNVNTEGFTAKSENVTKDSTAPIITEFVTGDSLSGESIARDKLTINISDSVSGLDSSSIQASDLAVNNDGERLEKDGISVNSGLVTVDLAEKLPTGATPSVEVTSTIIDNFGNEMDTYSPVTADDGLSPLIVSAVIDQYASNDSETVIEVNFTESIIADGGTITVNGTSLTFSDGNNLIEKHSVSYGSVLDTGHTPKLTSVSGIDDDSNSAQIKNSEVPVRSFRKDISEGMNMVSFPLEDKSNPKISEVLPVDKINVIWAYYDGEWNVYNPDLSSNDFNQIKGGYGYMIDSKENFTITPNINTASGDDVAEYPVSDGWNLVAQMQEFEQTADSSGAFADLSSGTVEQVRKLETADTLDYKRIDPDSTSPEKMEPGTSYWMESDGGDGLLTPSFDASQSNIVINVFRGIFGLFDSVFSTLVEVIL